MIKLDIPGMGVVVVDRLKLFESFLGSPFGRLGLHEICRGNVMAFLEDEGVHCTCSNCTQGCSPIEGVLIETMDTTPWGIRAFLKHEGDQDLISCPMGTR